MIYRTHAADFLHVIAATADDDVVLEESCVGLEIAEPREAEVAAECVAVEFEPCGLHVCDDAEAGHFFDGLWRHEVGVGEIGAGWLDGEFEVDAFVGFD